MSWCRFSTVLSDDTTSDLYIYENEFNSVTIHIAKKRRINESLAPKSPSFDDSDWVQKHDIRMKWLKEYAIYEDIDLKYAGETAILDDSISIVNFLTELKNIGYKFPDIVFEYASEYVKD